MPASGTLRIERRQWATTTGKALGQEQWELAATVPIAGDPTELDVRAGALSRGSHRPSVFSWWPAYFCFKRCEIAFIVFY